MRAPDPPRLRPVARAANDDLDRLRSDPLLEQIGRTPLVRIRRREATASHGSELWGKLEGTNPTGSVKDRAAVSIVREALASGELGPGRTLVDASSGNTAVSFAFLGARLGFPVRLFVPRNAHPDRLERIRAFGAEVVLTDPVEGTDGAQNRALALAQSDPSRYFYADQYSNPANPRAHYLGTGPEIWNQTHQRITHFVCGVGTGGTISGTARFLKEQDPRVEVVGVEPDVPMHGLEGLKHLPTARRPATYDARVVDRTVRVATEEALGMRATLAREDGVWVGPSSAAAVVAAVRVAAGREGSFVVALLPDQAPARGEAGP